MIHDFRAGHGKARHGGARHGKARQGMAWHGLESRGLQARPCTESWQGEMGVSKKSYNVFFEQPVCGICGGEVTGFTRALPRLVYLRTGTVKALCMSCLNQLADAEEEGKQDELKHAISNKDHRLWRAEKVGEVVGCVQLLAVLAVVFFLGVGAGRNWDAVSRWFGQ